MKTWTTNVIGVFDDDACFVQLPRDLLEEVNWKSGDTIEMIDNKDGSFTLTKKDGYERFIG